MNQKNIFTAIAAILLLQGISFYAMGDKLATDTFPGLDAIGKSAVIALLQVLSLLSILVAIISYANRSTPQVVGAFTLGFGLLLLLTLKHKFMDHINVPIWAVITQIAITLACVYLFMQNNKSKPA